MTNYKTVSPTAEPIRPAERSDLLERADMLLAIATVNDDGSPHVVPMWFVWRMGAFYMTCRREGRVKLRNMERDNRVYYTVYNMTLPYVALAGPGIAEVSERGAREVAAAIRAKYLGETVAREWAESASTDGTQVAIRVTPSGELSWRIP